MINVVKCAAEIAFKLKAMHLEYSLLINYFLLNDT